MIQRRPLGALALAALVAGCAGGPEPSVGGSGEFVDIPGIGTTRIDVPRPTGESSASCDVDPLPAASDEPMVGRVAALRRIGLFGDRGDMSDIELAASIEAELIAEWGTITAEEPIFDLIVAAADRSRVWWMDLEADVSDGNEVYGATLTEWADISVGAFGPTGIEEDWAGPEGPVTLHYTQAGVAYQSTPAYLEDWIDPRILIGINDAIEASGRRFELYKAFDQTALVVALTDDERQALEDRGWCFE